MKNQRYKEIKGDKELRQVSITEDQAKRLNANSKTTGLSYVAVKKEKATAVKINEVEFSKEDVIGALKIVDVKLNANTGVEKTQAAYDALEDDQKEAVQVELTKE